MPVEKKLPPLLEGLAADMLGKPDGGRCEEGLERLAKGELKEEFGGGDCTGCEEKLRPPRASTSPEFEFWAGGDWTPTPEPC